MKIPSKVVDAVLVSSTKEYLGTVVKELLNHYEMSYDYDNKKALNLLSIISGVKPLNLDNINMTAVAEVCKKNCYDGEHIQENSIHIKDIDNIDCYILIEYTTVDEGKETSRRSATLSYLDYPELRL